MNAICFPSGDHRGTAICSPCSEPATVCGSKIAVGSPLHRLRVHLRHPPVVLSRWRRRYIRQLLRVRRPVKLKHVQLCRRDLRQLSTRGIHRSHALNLKPFDPNHARLRLLRGQRSRRPRRSLHIKEAQPLPIWRPLHLLRESIHQRQLMRRRSPRRIRQKHRQLVIARAVGKERQLL